MFDHSPESKPKIQLPPGDPELRKGLASRTNPADDDMLKKLEDPNRLNSQTVAYDLADDAEIMEEFTTPQPYGAEDVLPEDRV